ncbi:MAG: hypothetical protein AMS14_10600 [Planctomycetes bacterium DG_20]|nr:MAG: hypothetical protein AMS14_10600 [Planctomycetes bacterium DG_20]
MLQHINEVTDAALSGPDVERQPQLTVFLQTRLVLDLEMAAGAEDTDKNGTCQKESPDDRIAGRAQVKGAVMPQRMSDEM